MSLIRARDITVRRGGKTILSGMNFHIDRGEIVTIVGPNGSGKTTFMRVLIGAEKASEGTLEHQTGLTIGYVPQKLQIGHTMPLTARRFLAVSGCRDRSAQDAMLERTGVRDAADRQLASLSGGEVQRVMLATALLSDPDILVLDEATQGLDQQGTAAFYRLIEEVRQERDCAVLMVSHDLHVVMSASDRVMCLNGHLCCEGTPTVVSAAPEYRALFGLGTEGALALYRHEHDHSHDCGHDHGAAAHADHVHKDARDKGEAAAR